MLPYAFLERMKEMLKDEFEAFEASYDRCRYKALRLNPLKWKGTDADTDINKVLDKLPKDFKLSKVPWAENGFYYDADAAPGKHPFHDAGLYYIQEPSAMLPGELLEAKPGETVLDLCSAPGGKGTQMAAKMQGEGLLVLNEIHPARAKILSENVERMGIRNAVVTNESPDRLADRFEEFFDRIMVDAPCSGEGMFVKNEEAVNEWSEENVEMCAKRQDEILRAAAGLLKPGGRIVYSTCTFAPLENEGTIARFLKEHTDFHVVKPCVFTEGMVHGTILDTVRLFPHLIKGEGHYAAVLEKDGSREDALNKCSYGMLKGIADKLVKDYIDFEKENLTWKREGALLLFGEQLYLAPKDCPSLDKLKVLRPGLHLGTLKKNRFEPSHALALTLCGKEVVHVHDIVNDEEQVRSYVNGQTLAANGEKGWYLILADGYSIGWGKLSDGVMKNHYPKGLRK